MRRTIFRRAFVLVIVMSVIPGGTVGIAAGPLLVDDFGKGDERTKAGDDYAARVYVVFPSALFWRTRAVNYIWANRLPRGSFLPNAYTGNAVMLAVESGDGNAGKWVGEERNLVEDYRRAFGEAPPRIGGVAIMRRAAYVVDDRAGCRTVRGRSSPSASPGGEADDSAPLHATPPSRKGVLPCRRPESFHPA